jgi:DNA topoisomerase II
LIIIQGIPVVVHKDENVYIPTMIFGQLLTGTNFNDTVKKVTGGRNGYGAKLANIFSTTFKLETVDTERGKKFTQTWKDNMFTCEKEKITDVKGKKVESYTCITFTPDLKRFNMDKLDDTIVEIMTKRVYDLCATCTGVSIHFNGKKLPIKNFEAYVKLYFAEDKEKKVIFENVSDRWQVGIALTDGEPQQVSFVNSICTTKGGKHVTYVQDQVVKKVLESIEKKNKGRKKK